MSLDIDSGYDIITTAIEKTIDEKILDLYFKSGSFIKNPNFIEFKESILHPKKIKNQTADEILSNVESILDNFTFKRGDIEHGIGSI